MFYWMIELFVVNGQGPLRVLSFQS
uniref:Uncharacterized protein n=1 Tax=Rhizophora mucronata TaxID=61149 RepID=A0A2P2PQE8_RHIMU